MADQERPRHRRRGIRASRRKLYKALADAGLKNQAALADRIAGLEGLDAAPIDVVSKVFREQTVDHQTLERVARALGSQSYKLYLTAEDAISAPGALGGTVSSVAAPVTTRELPAIEALAKSEPPATPILSHKIADPGRRRLVGPVSAVMTAALVAIAGVLYLHDDSIAPAVGSMVRSLNVLAPDSIRLVVTRFRGDREGEFGAAALGPLRARLRINSPVLQSLIADEPADEIARRMHANAVIGGEVVEVGQRTAVRVYLFQATKGIRQQIWAESFPETARRAHLQSVGEHISLAVLHSMGMQGAEPAIYFPTVQAQDHYLQGRLFMDRVHSELNMRRAQGHFEAAIREDPDYGAAHASLCAATLDAWWIDDENRQIADAEKSCEQAQRLSPGTVDTLRARAELLRKTGRAREAVELAQRAVEQEPGDTDSSLTLAASEFDLFRQTSDVKWGELALRHADVATKLSPKLAKPWQALATYRFYVSSVGDAIPAFERAHELDPANDYVIANLGTMYMCLGAVEKARDLYLQARAVAPASYTGDEFLGGVYFYLHDFAESARLRQLGVDGATAGGGGYIHQMWGALGDSYRRAGQRDKAVAAYRKALEIVERDFLVGNGVVSDKAHRAYYSYVLQALEKQRLPAAAIETLNAGLDEVYDGSTDSSGLLKVAQTWLLEGSTARAQLALEKAIRRCPGVARHPDVETLVQAQATTAESRRR